MLETIHAALAAQALLPRQPLVDGGSTDSETFVASERDSGVTVVGPVAADPRWQAREGTGDDQSACTIDWEAHTATCPHGNQRRKWHPDHDGAGPEVIHIRCANKACQACPARPACPRATTAPRTLTVRPPLSHEALHAARQHQTTAEFKEHSADRAGIAGTRSQGIRAFD